MAEAKYPILSICATVASKLPDLVIKNGQLVFVQDKHRIALDYNGKRVFYNQIEELATESERTSLLAPVVGIYYFVIETAVLWTYQTSGWVMVTTPPDEIIFVGTMMPELGKKNRLYVDKAKNEISIWDDDTSEYIVIADKTQINAIKDSDIESMF